MEENNPDLTAQEVTQGGDAADTKTIADAAPAKKLTDLSDSEIMSLLEDARNEGYLKGRNERIEEWLQTSAPYCEADSDDDLADEDSCPGFLAHIRTDFWDE